MYCKKNYRFYISIHSFNNPIKNKIILYLLLDLLINQKYIQFFYINKLYLFNFTSYIILQRSLYIYLLLQLEEEQNYTLYFIQQNHFYNPFSKFWFNYRSNYTYFPLNKKIYTRNKFNYNAFSHSINVRHWYKNMNYFDFNWLFYNYLLLFCNFNSLDLRYKSRLTILKIRSKFHSYDVFNYFLIKQTFKVFINIIINSLVYNHIPFFVCSKRLEDDVLLLYSFFLYLKTSILYKTRKLKYIVNLRKVRKFKRLFGLPSFFFILDIHKLLPGLSIVRKYKLPISGFVTSNMNFEQYDYPFFITKWSHGCIYLNYLIVLQLLFFGLKKKKQFFWHFFIKYKIIYILKKKILELN